MKNKINEKEITKIMNQKGYELSTFNKFEEDCWKGNIINQSVTQIAVCEHNLNVFLKPIIQKGKFYFVRLTKGLEVRVWQNNQTK